MAVVTIASLKAKWITGYVPTQADYVDLFDTLSNLQTIVDINGVISDGAVIGNPSGGAGFYFDASSMHIDGLIELLDYVGGGVRTLTVTNLGAVVAESRPFVYDAIITQIGIDAPFTCDLEYNVRDPFVQTLAGTWNYVSPGIYQFVANGKFADMTKVDIKIADNRYNAGLQNVFGFDFKVDDDTLQFKAVQYSGLSGPSTATNSIVAIQPIEIKVYP